MREVFVIRDEYQMRRMWAFFKRHAKELADSGTPLQVVVTLFDMARTSYQNAAQWPILTAFSKQKKWSVNGELVYLSEEDWKDLLTCAFEVDTGPRVAAGINGGVVMLGHRTSRYGKKKFSQYLDFLQATAIELDVDVDWSQTDIQSARGKYVSQ